MLGGLSQRNPRQWSPRYGDTASPTPQSQTFIAPSGAGIASGLPLAFHVPDLPRFLWLTAAFHSVFHDHSPPTDPGSGLSHPRRINASAPPTLSDNRTSGFQTDRGGINHLVRFGGENIPDLFSNQE